MGREHDPEEDTQGRADRARIETPEESPVRRPEGGQGGRGAPATLAGGVRPTSTLVLMEHTEDGRHIIVDGRRWRAADPALSEDVAGRLRSHLGRARSAVRTASGDDERRAARDRVQLAKEGLGERGDAWWDLEIEDRTGRAHDRLQQLERLAPA